MIIYIIYGYRWYIYGNIPSYVLHHWLPILIKIQLHKEKYFVSNLLTDIFITAVTVPNM